MKPTKEQLEAVFKHSPTLMSLLEKLNEEDLSPYEPFDFEAGLASFLVELDLAQWGDDQGGDDDVLSLTESGRGLVDWMNREACSQ